MSFIDSYEKQLVAAAERQRDARLRHRAGRFVRTLVPRRRGPAIALAALLVGVPAAAATVGPWDPFEDDTGRNPRFPAPTTSQRPLDPGLVSTLGVLRRQQTGADRSPAARRAARAFSSETGFRGARVDGIRVLDASRGIVLIPFERGPAPTDPEGRGMPGFDPARFRNLACVFELTGDGFAGVGCHNAADIRAGRAVASGSGRVTGLVPDGVEGVRLVRGRQAVQAPVQDNLWVAEDADPPSTVEWIAPNGSVAKRIELARRP